MTVAFVLPLKLLRLLRSIYDSGFCVATETAVARSIRKATDGYKQPREVEGRGRERE